MPAWIIITEVDLNEARVAELITALREEALGVSQPDPMPGIITKVVNEIRSCIGFCSATALDINAAKVPANLKDMIVQKIVRTMKGRLLQSLTDDETVEEKVYQSRLLLLTTCDWPVDSTDTPISFPTVSSPAVTPAITCRRRESTRAKMDGI